MIKAINAAGMQHDVVPFKKPTVDLAELAEITSSGRLT